MFRTPAAGDHSRPDANYQAALFANAVNGRHIVPLSFLFLCNNSSILPNLIPAKMCVISELLSH